MILKIFSTIQILIWTALVSMLYAHISELNLEEMIDVNVNERGQSSTKATLMSSYAVVNTIVPTPYKVSCAKDMTYEVTAKTFTFVFVNATLFPQSANILKGTFQRYRTLIFDRLDAVNATPSGGQVAVTARVVVLSDLVSLNIDTNESYTLFIAQPDTFIAAKTVYGAMRAIETLSQLITYQNKTFLLYKCDIVDRPKYQHRGILFDTGRHFLPLSILKRHLDVMEWYKYNVLHWHIVDDQSFPYVSKAFPSLSEKGAYTQLETYSPPDVQDIIDYAAQRGIRVIPEFDTPGHSQSWGKGMPGLLTECYNTSTGKPDGTYGPINALSNIAWPFLEKLFLEISQVFPDDYMHLGGDEVSFGCWMTNPQIQAWMKKNNYTDYSKFEAYYINRLIKYVTSSAVKSKVVVWQEVFDNKNNIPLSSIVHVWKGGVNYAPELEAVTKAGYSAILSSCWYLDVITRTSDWLKYYNCDPLNFNGTAEMKSRVLGGEACAWGEYMDATNSVSRVWPRALGAAERLWSINNTTSTDYNVVYSRLHPNRCRLLARGIQAQPLGPGGYCDYEFEPLFPKLGQ